MLQSMVHGAVDAPLTVHRETLLSNLPPCLDHQYILVSDDDERIIGVVPSREIARRILSSNAFERTRWLAMPVGSMLSMEFGRSEAVGPKFENGELECSAICEDGKLFGLSVDGDLFLNWRRLESVFTAAMSDPLTGLMNRLSFERRLREEWNRSQRTFNSIGIVIVDLDEFKSINDTYGHVIGDQVLSQVGRQLELSMRSYDVVARFGGDEFVALCLGVSPEEIVIPVKRLLDSLAEIEIPVGDDIIRVAASVGAAVQHTDFECALPEDLFVAADNCLYEAKKSSANSWKTEFRSGGNETPKPIVLRDANDPKLITLATDS